MRSFKLFALLMLIPALAWTSGGGGNYLPKKSLKTPNSKVPTVQKNQKYQYFPSPKKPKALEKHIYSFDRKGGVTINSISVAGGFFTITGIYKSEKGLLHFVKQIKGEGNPDREVKVEKKITRGIAGIKNKEYIITAKNAW